MIVHGFYNAHSETSNKNFTEIIQYYQNYTFLFFSIDIYPN